MHIYAYKNTYITAAVILVAFGSTTPELLFYYYTYIPYIHTLTIHTYTQSHTNTNDITAAVTLVAFGSATPELLLNSIAALEHTSDISMSATLGE